MALKKKLTKAEYDKLKNELKENYIEDGDDGYKLDLEGDEDTGALKRAKDREVQLRKEAEKRAKDAEDRLSELDSNDARKKGDIETLERQWKEKHQKEIDKLNADNTAEKTALTEKLTKRDSTLSKQLIDNKAQALSIKLNPKLAKVLEPHIKARLSADLEGDEPITVILDTLGKPSKLTMDQLEAEFVANKDFAGIIIGSKASGSAGNTTPGSANKTTQTEQAVDLSKLSPKDLAAHVTQVREQQSQES